MSVGCGTSEKLLELRVTYLFYSMILCLPLWGFSLLNIGGRGIRIDWVLIGIMGCVFYLEVCSKRIIPIRDSIWIYIIILNFCICLSVLMPLSQNNPNMLIDFSTTFLQIQLCFVLFVFACHIEMNNEQIRRLILFYLILSSILATFGILQFIGSKYGYNLRLVFTNVGRVDPHSGYEVLTGGFSRSTSFFSEPRQFGNYLVVRFCIVFSAILYHFDLFHKRYLCYLMLAILGLGILSSLSVSAFFVLSISLIVIVATSSNIEFLFMGSLFLGLLCFMLVIIYFSLGPENILVAGLFRRLSFLQDLTSLYEQFTQMNYKPGGIYRYIGNWRFATDTVMLNPMTGVGLNNLVYYEKYGLHGVHGILGFVAQTGFLGAGAYIMFLGSLLRKYLRLRRTISFYDQWDYKLASIGILFIIIPFVVSFGSLYNFSSTFFWLDISIAGLIYFNLRRKYQEYIFNS